ncbi:NAD(P)H-binding protein [Streptomyces sp. NPDC004561]
MKRSCCSPAGPRPNSAHRRRTAPRPRSRTPPSSPAASWPQARGSPVARRLAEEISSCPPLPPAFSSSEPPDAPDVHGSDNDSRADSARRVDYGGVVNVMRALGDRKPRIVLQTSIFVTRRGHYFNAGGHALDWKRCSERVVRLSGAPYTIVRPGWLDGGEAGRHATIEQGDTGEGGISREVLGTLLVEALLTKDALGKTFEAYSGPGRATRDWAALFGRAVEDAAGALDAVEDTANMPLEEEPARVRSDLAEFRTH